MRQILVLATNNSLFSSGQAHLRHDMAVMASDTLSKTLAMTIVLWSSQSWDGLMLNNLFDLCLLLLCA